MAISNYSELQAAVSNWMARADVSGDVVDFITLAEARLTRKLPELRSMEGASFALSDAEPTNWLLTNHPDIYLYAVLVWGGLFDPQGTDAAKYKTLLEEAIDELMWLDARLESQEPLTFDPALLPCGRSSAETEYLVVDGLLLVTG
jgi:hypothetical protein